MPTPTIAVTCAASDQGGEAVAGGIYTAKLDQTEIYDGFVVPEQVTATADADGLAILNLWPNALGVNGSSYRITARNPDTGKKFFDASVVVPNNPCNLYQIIQNAPFPNVDSAQQALIDVQALVTIANQDVAATNADAQQAAADRLQTGEDRTAARDSAANALTSEQIVVAAHLDITTNWSDKLATAAVQAGISTTQAGLAATAKEQAELARNAMTIYGVAGYSDSVAYSANLAMTSATQIVNYLGKAYAPLLSALPFTTSGTFEAAKFRLIQGVAAVDLATSGGAGMVGRPVGTVGSKLDEIPSLRDTGGVADYAGTALYDGADVGRITATDNTAAFNLLISTAIASGRTAVKIPAGHWAIKTGNLSFSGFDKLRIYGDGIGVTILDFVKEDATRVAYVDNANAPHVIASFATGNSIEFADMTIKATTKAGVVNGTSGPANSAAVYYGAVWGLKINNVKDVRFTRVRAERFNYRGFSVYGSATERVTMMHCEGFYNAGSGFWVQDAAVFKIIGGEYAYNGIFGETGTGYGVTASARVGKYIVESPYCHHNYRKGIDTHGSAMVDIKGGTYENNVLYHIAAPNWTPPAGVVDVSVSIKGGTFSNGKLPADRAWLKACYDALAANGYTTDTNATGCIIFIADTDAVGAALNKMKSVVIEDITVLAHYNGVSDTAMTAANFFIAVTAPLADIGFKGNRLNLEHAAFPSAGNVYAHVGIALRGVSTDLDSNKIKFLQATQYTNATSGLTDYGTLFEFLNGGAKTLNLRNNLIELNDALLMTGTATGVRSPIVWTVAGSARSAKGNTFSFLSDQYRGAAGLNDAYFLGTDAAGNVPLQASANTFIRAGVAYAMPNGDMGRTSGSLTYKLAAVSKAIGVDVFSIVLDKQYASSIRISTKDGSADLFITIPFSSYAGLTGSTGNALLEYSSVDAAFVENGVTKLKITVKAKAALSGDYWGRIVVDGFRPSLGIERVILL